MESVNVHDHVTCSCEAFSVDGEHDYLRRNYATSLKFQTCLQKIFLCGIISKLINGICLE
ncbi:DUF7695 domain-containing protein [Streptococcus lutetiensis]|uniref:DUF7695 domain-containing protein n=1 Tax=Streptococcus lutetiensis TaxID=150055 RepID=UPI003CCC5EDA